MKQDWCQECKALVTPKVIEWESSIAVIYDMVCPKHERVFFARTVLRKRWHPTFRQPSETYGDVTVKDAGA